VEITEKCWFGAHALIEAEGFAITSSGMLHTRMAILKKCRFGAHASGKAEGFAIFAQSQKYTLDTIPRCARINIRSTLRV